MAEPQPTTAPAGRQNRKVKNFLLDARFQLKFASYFVVTTLFVCAVLGLFLFRTTTTLFEQTSEAVGARAKAAETSRELGRCSLNNELTQQMDDPEFVKSLEARSKAIDATFEAESQATLSAQADLVAQQHTTVLALFGALLGFIALIAAVAIVITHRIVGPLFRIKRMAREVAGGVVRPPTYGLRPSDELHDVFEVFAKMVTELRARTEEELSLAKAAQGGDGVALEKLTAVLQERLDRKA
jgi:methyl-accepting chemotaxis protein